MSEPPKDSAQIILSAKSGNRNQAIQHSAIPYIGAKCGSGYYHCGSILLVWQWPLYIHKSTGTGCNTEDCLMGGGELQEREKGECFTRDHEEVRHTAILNKNLISLVHMK